MSIKNFRLRYDNLARVTFGTSGNAFGVIGGGGGSLPSTMVAPPTITGYAVVGQVMWVDDGSDDPETTYTRQWVSGASDPPSTPISGQTALSITVPSIAGDYIACLVTPANGQPARLSDVYRVHAATMTAPVLLRTSADGGTPFTYTVTYDNTVFADDIERVQYASDIDFTTILWDATRGLTEAAFITPFLPDDTVDADPPWSEAPPTFTGTYFVRRKVQSLDGFVESNWSNTESNFAIDLAVRGDPTASYDAGGGDAFAFSPDKLTFTCPAGTSSRMGRVNYARSANRVTFEMQVTTLNTLIWLGLDDGSFNWDAAVTIATTGWKGMVVQVNPFGATNSTRIADGTTITPIGSSGVWQNNDIIRIDYTKGTFTLGVPDNNGTAIIERIRSGTKTTQATLTGIPSMVSVKPIFGGANSSVGVLKFDALTPAIDAGSQEYQDAT